MEAVEAVRLEVSGERGSPDMLLPELCGHGMTFAELPATRSCGYVTWSPPRSAARRPAVFFVVSAVVSARSIALRQYWFESVFFFEIVVMSVRQSDVFSSRQCTPFA